jgi:hypothetical protein
MAHAQKPDLVFRRNGGVHLNRRGRQFSRLLAAEVCASAVVMLVTPCSEVVWSVLATHSICQFPLHFPSRASPCAIAFQLDSNTEVRSCNHRCSGQEMSITYPEHLFLALVIQHVMSLRHIVICDLPRSTNFSTLSHKRYDFRKKKVLKTKYVFWFSLQLLSGTYLILRRNGWDMIKNVYWPSYKVAFVLVRF